jgi:hypothetical protein
MDEYYGRDWSADEATKVYGPQGYSFLRCPIQLSKPAWLKKVPHVVLFPNICTLLALRHVAKKLIYTTN